MHQVDAFTAGFFPGTQLPFSYLKTGSRTTWYLTITQDNNLAETVFFQSPARWGMGSAPVCSSA